MKKLLIILGFTISLMHAEKHMWTQISAYEKELVGYFDTAKIYQKRCKKIHHVEKLCIKCQQQLFHMLRERRSIASFNALKELIRKNILNASFIQDA